MAWITIADVLATLAVPLAIRPSHAAHAALGALIVAAAVAAVFLVAHRLRGSREIQRIRKEGKRRGWAIDLRVALIILVALAYLAREDRSEPARGRVRRPGSWWPRSADPSGSPRRCSGSARASWCRCSSCCWGPSSTCGQLTSSGRTVLLAVMLALLTIAVHLLVSVVIRAPRAVGLLATAQVGVPAAVISLGLADHTLTQGQASAIFCAALASIGACAAGAAILRRSGGDHAGGDGGGRGAGHPGDHADASDGRRSDQGSASSN